MSEKVGGPPTSNPAVLTIHYVVCVCGRVSKNPIRNGQMICEACASEKAWEVH